MNGCEKLLKSAVLSVKILKKEGLRFDLECM